MLNLKLYFILIFCFLLGSNLLNAQKAKFKNKSTIVQKTRLPTNYTAPENRTYALYKKGAYSTNIDVHEKGIYGWTLDQDNPNLKGVISVYGFSMGTAQKSAQKKEKKDKEGKVINSWVEYTYSASAQGKGNLYIYGVNNPFVYRKNEEKSKLELKKEETEAAIKKDLEDNPFLSAEDIEEVEKDQTNEDSGLTQEKLQFVKKVNINTSQKVETNAHKSATAAYKEFIEKEKPLLHNFQDNYPQSTYNKAIRSLNYRYGYTPINNRFLLKKMKSEKHPQYEKWNDACQATQTLFKAFKYNKSIEESQSKFRPIVDYFAGIVEEIPDSNGKAKKMKKVAFQNMVNILYYLDKHDEVISLCDKNSSSKVLDKIAKRMQRKSKELKALLEFHKMNNCHIKTMEEIDLEDIETEDVNDGEEETANNKTN